MLIEGEHGTVCGGYAAVPWKPWDYDESKSADPLGESFIFSLSPTVERFGIVKLESALINFIWIGFGSNDLIVYSDGIFQSDGADAYAGPRSSSLFTGCPAKPDHLAKFRRLEFWQL